MSWRENFMSPPLWGAVNLGTKICSSWKVKIKVVPTPTDCVRWPIRKRGSEDRLMYSNATVGIADDKGPSPSFCLSLVSIVQYSTGLSVPLRNSRVYNKRNIRTFRKSFLGIPCQSRSRLQTTYQASFLFLVSSTWVRLRESLNARHATQPTQAQIH